jgi:hypothetical protein
MNTQNPILFHLAGLFSIQLIALTFAIFLFIYIKRQELCKRHTFVATAIIGVILLMMLATFIGIVCMASRLHINPENERDGYNREEMRERYRGYNDGREGEENCNRYERRDCNREDAGGFNYGNEGGKDYNKNEECGGKRNFHHKYINGNWTMSEDKTIEIKDSITKTKTPKK